MPEFKTEFVMVLVVGNHACRCVDDINDYYVGEYELSLVLSQVRFSRTLFGLHPQTFY